ncbi:hypothetical protein [Mucilaginibacter agri]|uniref:Uncharacterized protein n=1 Tax=Mucilaginibacter agri TaxID=2695265 RepID=A0A966DVV9_9SPHI|nr:hypothetical protein [Mucilaginibacter agri]NCD71857.1 hypothetical protein [Mucilaginibacter agri]
MALYTTRIEILGSNDHGAYQTLNDAMEANGFFCTIQLTSTSPVYKLPTGEYNWIGEMNASFVLEAAVKAAAQITNQVRILITKVDNIREWYNLEEVK